MTTSINGPEAGSQLRIAIHAAIRRASMESDITTYQVLGALRMVEKDIISESDDYHDSSKPPSP